MLDCLFKTVKRYLEHGEYLLDRLDGLGVRPGIFILGVEPYTMFERLGKEFKLFYARVGPGVVVDAAVPTEQLVGRHGRVAHDDQPGSRVEPGEILDR